MRKTVAGWLIRLAHCIYRPQVTEGDWAEFADTDLGWESDPVHVPESYFEELGRYHAGAEIELPWAEDGSSRPTSSLLVTYTGGPEGPAARKIRLAGIDGSEWDLSGPPSREEC